MTPKQYRKNNEVIGEIDDIAPRFILNPCAVRYDYSTRTVRDDYSYGTRTVQYSRSLPSTSRGTSTVLVHVL